MRVAQVDAALERREAAREPQDVLVLDAARDVQVRVPRLRPELLADAELGRHRSPRLPGDEHAAEALKLGLAQERVDGRAAGERLEACDVLRGGADRARPLADVPGIDVGAERARVCGRHGDEGESAREREQPDELSHGRRGHRARVYRSIALLDPLSATAC